MTNDLISRKEALELIRNIAYSRYLSTFECKFYEDIYNVIKKIPIAYDLDAVCEEINQLKNSEFDMSDEEPDLTDPDVIYDEAFSQGKIDAFNKSVDIIKKGSKQK